MNGFIRLKFSETEGTNSVLSVVKKTNMTARLRYNEHKTPNRDENLRALAFLGNDIGKRINKENIVALNI